MQHWLCSQICHFLTINVLFLHPHHLHLLSFPPIMLPGNSAGTVTILRRLLCNWDTTGRMEKNIQQSNWKTHFLDCLSSSMPTFSLFSPPTHPLQRNTASNPSQMNSWWYLFSGAFWTFGGARWFCVLITLLVRINPNLIRPNEKWREDRRKQELVYSCLGAVQNNSLNCPGLALTSLRLLSQMSLCMNAHCHFCQIVCGLISPFLLWCAGAYIYSEVSGTDMFLFLC